MRVKDNEQKKGVRLGNKKAIQQALIQINSYLHSVGSNLIFPMHDSEAIETYALYTTGQKPENLFFWAVNQYRNGLILPPEKSKPVIKVRRKKKKVGKPNKPKRAQQAEDAKRKRKYAKYLMSAEWKAKREQLFELRGKQCEKCGSTKTIQVHHIHYRNIFKERMDDLQVLCKRCHECVHKRMKRKKNH
jgi:5-methylcytosine-specific restriction endonuclease McrA